jgi:cytoskeleton protein RodZ
VGQFGDKFRKAREKKGISLDDVSNVTKIGSRMLQAIEEEHFDQLPGGVFNKGFIRAYAKHLGINDQEAVTEYLECLRQEQVKAQAVWQPQARPAPEKRPAAPAVKPQNAKASAPVATQYEELPELQLPKAEHARPSREKYLDQGGNAIPLRLIVATVVVLLLAAVLWRRHVIGNASSQAATSAPIASATNASAPIASSTSAPPLPAAPSVVASSNGTTPATGSGSGPGNAAASPAATTKSSKEVSDGSDSGDNDVVVRNVQGATAAPDAKPFTLVIRATENSWISVTADGQNVSQENLIAPAHASIRANHEIVARVGNAAGVVFLWNGKEIPADGAEAEVKTFVFDAQGMRAVASPSPNQAP